MFESISSMYNILFYIVTFLYSRFCVFSIPQLVKSLGTDVYSSLLASSHNSPAFGTSKAANPTNSMNNVLVV